MKKNQVALMWFRSDLRIDDNEAFFASCAYSHVIALFIWDQKVDYPWECGEASKWWLHHGLTDLKACLAKKGLPLVILKGDRFEILKDLVFQFSVTSLFWNRSYDPKTFAFDEKIKSYFLKNDVHVGTFQANLICEPGSVLKSDKSLYLVFTAFWRAFINGLKPFKLLDSKAIPSFPKCPFGAEELSLPIDRLELLPKIPWDKAFYKLWDASLKGASLALEEFIKESILTYQIQRDLPAVSGTSRLSPYLHFGQIHPKRIFYMIEKAFGPIQVIQDQNILQFCKEVVWREFAYHLLFYYPSLPLEPMKKSFQKFPWKNDKTKLRAWKKGLTGYPIVDAGMRELWQTGWMHNRVRMIVASFLTKDLHISWQEGALWFWDTLVDADLANNTQGWQWVAGCGFDAAPFFRIFNPVTQGEKFDPEGLYVKKWCPELALLPSSYIHKPWLAPASVLTKAGVRLGTDYPKPIVDHKESREYSLKAFEKL